jgi:hypothetical protein
MCANVLSPSTCRRACSSLGFAIFTGKIRIAHLAQKHPRSEFAVRHGQALSLGFRSSRANVQTWCLRYPPGASVVHAGRSRRRRTSLETGCYSVAKRTWATWSSTRASEIMNRCIFTGNSRWLRLPGSCDDRLGTIIRSNGVLTVCTEAAPHGSSSLSRSLSNALFGRMSRTPASGRA